MKKEIISTKEAPGAIGPYSQATKFNDIIYTSGQLPIDPQTGNISSDIKDQTEQVFKNAEAILKAAGSDLTKVIKTSVFLKDLQDFAAMNEVYGKFFTDNHPARSTVGNTDLALGALVEIEFIAHI
ncbi:RidA family protein [Halosquirtibacter xylanolyticus]|uniref:RidA family protein n=1 Tax=Halosquirtibacter xylanolyticus TaxID=3374599 RepID=UPI00374A4855|nr:RidA family protein [Prolixibacteraceae bacterium]